MVRRGGRCGGSAAGVRRSLAPMRKRARATATAAGHDDNATAAGHTRHADTTGQGNGNSQRARPTATGAGHTRQQQATGQAHSPSQQADGKDQTKRARAHDAPARPREILNAPARAKVLAARRSIPAGAEAQNFFRQGVKKSLPWGPDEKQKGGQKCDKGAGRGAASGKRAQKSTVLTHGAGGYGI